MNSDEILKMVDAFYSNAFSNLIIFTGAVIGIVGGLIPFIMQQIQFRYFRDEKENITSHIENTINEKVKEISAEMSKKFQEEKDKLEKQFEEKFDEEIMHVRAGIFFIQGVNAINQKEYEQAANSFAIASHNAILGKDERNGQTALSNLIDICLPNLYDSNFTDTDDLNNSIKDLLEMLNKKNENKRFSNAINAIEKGVAAARKRELSSVPVI